MKKCFLSQKGPKAIGPYSTLTRAGGVCYVSGMLGVNPETGKLAEGVAAQAQQAFTNLRTVPEEIGLNTGAICKTTVFLQDLNDFAAVNAIYAEYFGPDYPARSCVQVAKLPMGGLLEIEAIAVED